MEATLKEESDRKKWIQIYERKVNNLMRLYPAGGNILEPLQVENEYWGKSPNLKLLGDLLVGLALYAIDLILLPQLLLLGEGL